MGNAVSSIRLLGRCFVKISRSKIGLIVVSIVMFGTGIAYQNCGEASITENQTLNKAPTDDSDASAIVDISAGYNHTCVLRESGNIECWGHNYSGELGVGNTVNSYLPVRAEIMNAKSLDAGLDFTCAVNTDGEVYCWGDNGYGQMGNGNMDKQFIPKKVPGISNATMVEAGLGHVCALLADKTVKCWGYNSFGQLGNGNFGDQLLPTPVTGINDAVSINLGFNSCALLSTGQIKCWGANPYGQIGNGTTGADINVPNIVSGINNAKSVTMGFNHACALLADRTVKCWGSNAHGQLANGAFGGSSNVPVAVAGLTDVAFIQAGAFHTCAIQTSGKAKCWGMNDNGQIGNNSTTNVATPSDVVEQSNFTRVDSDNNHTCGLTKDGDVFCWGNDEFGQIGNNTKGGHYQKPTKVSNLR